MKRFVSLLLVLNLSIFLAGCPSGGGEQNGGSNGPAASSNGDAGPATGGGQFKEGVGSGRAEDGSDEDK